MKNKFIIYNRSLVIQNLNLIVSVSISLSVGLYLIEIKFVLEKGSIMCTILWVLHGLTNSIYLFESIKPLGQSLHLSNLSMILRLILGWKLKMFFVFGKIFYLMFTFCSHNAR